MRVCNGLKSGKELIGFESEIENSDGGRSFNSFPQKVKPTQLSRVTP